MYDYTIDLIKVTQSISDIGDVIEEETERREVFCRVASADYKEKTLAESRGKTANFTFILPDVNEYEGEIFLEFNGIRYEVLDTKFSDSSNEIRLVVGKWSAS